jgi:2-haloacid dehalogenase
MIPSRLPAPRWLSFDCYGTLIDWETGVRRAFRDLAAVRAGEDEAELFRVWERLQWNKIQGAYVPYAQIMQESFRESLDQLGYRAPLQASEAFLRSLAGWEPFADVKAALTRLAQRFRLAIISNTDRDLLGLTLRHFPVRFDALITAEDARTYKPNPEIFRVALTRMNCDPNEVVHVAFGAEYDLRPAGTLGIRTVYLNRGKPLPAGFSVEGQVESLEDLAKLWE